MSGAIGVIAQDDARDTMFWISLFGLAHPPNTRIEWGITSDRCIGRNSCAKRALEAGSEWIIFLDDDHAFPPSLLTQLLAHDVPVVGALYLQRCKPFLPIAYTAKTAGGFYVPLRLNEYAPDELIEVHAVGTGGMLIRSEVLREVPYPWFEQQGGASEDLMFCEKVNDAGLGPIYCDLGARMGHFMQSAIWPAYNPDGEKWQNGVILSDGYRLDLPLSEFELVDEDEEEPQPAPMVSAPRPS